MVEQEVSSSQLHVIQLVPLVCWTTPMERLFFSGYEYFFFIQKAYCFVCFLKMKYIIFNKNY